MSRPHYPIIDLYSFLAQDEEWVAASAEWERCKEGADAGNPESIAALVDSAARYLTANTAACDRWVRR